MPIFVNWSENRDLIHAGFNAKQVNKLVNTGKAQMKEDFSFLVQSAHNMINSTAQWKFQDGTYWSRWTYDYK